MKVTIIVIDTCDIKNNLAKSVLGLISPGPNNDCVTTDKYNASK